ncbi:thiolase family protein [Sphaerisporangium sp. NPDC088356]|uniref:thiolase family protein n=1 Tax=Sphaerisporangium sp. NPDC088356 TaxID=3154871 RepID=UPI003425BBA6
MDAFVLGSVRTPVGKRGGSLANTRPDELLALTLRELVTRTGTDPAAVDDVLVGCVNAVEEQGRNVGRLAVLEAGFPVSVPAVTMNRMCGSSQQAVNFAAQAVMSGQQSLVIAAGVESMSRIPLGSDAGDSTPSPALTERYEFVNQGMAAEMIAEHWRISRREMDEFSVESHHRAARAWSEGRYAEECFPVVSDAAAGLLGRPGGDVRLAQDEGVRAGTSIEKVSALAPAFKPDGRVHAGNSSQISDGAAAVLIGSAETAERLGLRPRARVVATHVVGVDPIMMLHGVIDATTGLLARTGLKADDVGLYEINEAFASVVLAWERELKVPLDRVNVNGGAIAIGHPTGCSGARLMTTLVHEMARRDVRYGVQAMCIGHGMATATLLERV